MGHCRIRLRFFLPRTFLYRRQPTPEAARTATPFIFLLSIEQCFKNGLSFGPASVNHKFLNGNFFSEMLARIYHTRN